MNTWRPISRVELEDLLKKCDGLGISGANENSTAVLQQYSKTPKMRAIHSSETRQSVSTSKKITGKSETISPMDEIKKAKELLDAGAITPEEFENYGKYHIFLSNGCFVGSIFGTSTTTYSDRFIFQEI